MKPETKPLAHGRLRLRDILKSRKMTQGQFAVLVGMSQPGVNTLTGTPRQIRIDTLAQICAALEITPDELIEITINDK